MDNERAWLVRRVVVSLPEAQAGVRDERRAHLQGLTYNGYTLQPSAPVESATSVVATVALPKTG
jgi:hypothetical protein